VKRLAAVHPPVCKRSCGAVARHHQSDAFIALSTTQRLLCLYTAVVMRGLGQPPRAANLPRYRVLLSSDITSVILGLNLLLAHTHPFNGLLSRTTRVGRYQKGKTNLDLLKQETVSGSSISWAICKSAPCSRQITTPAPHHSVFYRPDALPAAQPTASKHWRQEIYYWQQIKNIIHV